MDVLWAPWRMDYIQNADPKVNELDNRHLPFLSGSDESCFLCQAAVAPTSQDDQRHIVRRTDHLVTLLNLYPYNNGHLLIAPKRHIDSLELLASEEWSEITQEMTFWTERIKQLMNADGFNIGLNLGRVAGAGLPGHLHWHIIPRWNGDTNFITTIGSTKVIPQSLEAVTKLFRNTLQ